MKSFIVLAVLVAVAIAAPVEQLHERNAEILTSTFDNLYIDRPYSYGFETINDTSLPEGGYAEGLVVPGEYSYSGPDGKLYRYIADKDGFRPIDEHISA